MCHSIRDNPVCEFPHCGGDIFSLITIDPAASGVHMYIAYDKYLGTFITILLARDDVPFLFPSFDNSYLTTMHCNVRFAFVIYM